MVLFYILGIVVGKADGHRAQRHKQQPPQAVIQRPPAGKLAAVLCKAAVVERGKQHRHHHRDQADHQAAHIGRALFVQVRLRAKLIHGLAKLQLAQFFDAAGHQNQHQRHGQDRGGKQVQHAYLSFWVTQFLWARISASSSFTTIFSSKGCFSPRIS